MEITNWGYVVTAQTNIYAYAAKNKEEAFEKAKGYADNLTASERKAVTIEVCGYDINVEAQLLVDDGIFENIEEALENLQGKAGEMMVASPSDGVVESYKI